MCVCVCVCVYVCVYTSYTTVVNGLTDTSSNPGHFTWL